VFIWIILVIACLDVVAGIAMGISKKQSFPYLSEFESSVYFWVALGAAISAFFACIFLLRKKEWARKLLLISVLVSLVATFGFNAPFKKHRSQVADFEKQMETSAQKTFVIMSEEGEGLEKEDWEKFKNLYIAQHTKQYALRLGLFYLAWDGGLALFDMAILIFFTRRKVKRKFQQVVTS